ncbi:MAG TPA: hypothetical protein VJU81_23990 [Methylomirabilota bacterium]|nr:hypothetical protein [Methylomirabilota bacterium]
MKSLVMILAPAFFTGASVACFGLFSGDTKDAGACQGLSGQAKTDCEREQGAK